MIHLMDMNKVSNSLFPVNTSEIFIGKSRNFHPSGLFSESIFGALNTSDRKNNYSYIDLNTKILHPAMRAPLYRINRKLILLMSGKKKYRLEKGNLIEDVDGDIYGMNKFFEIIDDIQFRGGTQARDDIVKMINYYRKNNMMFIDKCFVIPPYFRNIEFNEDGTSTMDQLNDYYINIINASNQISSISSGDMHNILSHKIYYNVLELYKYLSSKITKKQGIIRKNILGKRVDFSARAVISGGSSELQIDEIGVPFNLLVRIFEPFLMHVILNSGKIDTYKLQQALSNYNNTEVTAISLRKLFIGIYKHDELPSDLLEIISQAIRIAIQDKVVLAKRDPSLHAESVQAFKPVLIYGNTIKLHPLKCSAYNADFDGDQLALYTPITKEAIKEAREKMITSISKDGYGQISDDFQKDICLGIYFLTKTPNKISYIDIPQGSILKNMNAHQGVYYKNIKTTVGRILFNEALPDKYEFINEPVDRKYINKIAYNILNNYSYDEYKYFCKRSLDLSFQYGTLISRSFSFQDFKIPKTILALKDKLKGKSPEDAQKIIDKMTNQLQQYMESHDTNVGDIGNGGGLKGGYDQARQILIAKGLIKDPTGKTLPPISESYGDGMSSKEFFISGSGSRSGIADRVLNTATTGYMSRQLVFATQRTEVDSKLKDCRTKRFVNMNITQDIAKRLHGRYVIDRDNNIVKFNEKTMLNTSIKLRSPVYCTSHKICATCYGDLLYNNKSIYAGVQAGQSIGELVTQAIMKTFHSGGAVSIKTIDILKLASDYLSISEFKRFNMITSQVNNDLIMKKSGKLIITTKEYLNITQDIKFIDDTIYLEYGYFKIIMDNAEYDLAFDTNTIINLKNKEVDKSKSIITVSFNSGDVLFTCPPTSDNFGDRVKIMSHLFSGKKPWKNSDHFLMKIYDILHDLTGMDFVHFEILASQLLRDSGNPTYPARLNAKNYKPMIVSLKNIPTYESWMQSLEFENFNKSITNGMMYDNKLDESILEKLVSGKL